MNDNHGFVLVNHVKFNYKFLFVGSLRANDNDKDVAFFNHKGLQELFR